MTLVLLFSNMVFAQESNENKSEGNSTTYNTAGIEVKPEFPGGIQEFYKYIAKKFRTPNKLNSGGKMLVEFVIDKDGSIVDINVTKDLGYGTDKEIIRVLKKCPKWIPGMQNGKNVRVFYRLPLSIPSS